MAWGWVGELFNKFVPKQRRRDVRALNKLEVQYAKALEENRDTDASIIRKEIRTLRKELGYAEM